MSFLKHHPWPRRRLVVLVAVVVLVVGTGGAFALSRRTSDTPATQQRTVAATVGTMQQTVAATGTLAPATESDLSFTSSGTVTKLDVAVGQKVSKGQALAAIDGTALRSALDVASAQEQQARTQVTSATSAGSATAATAAQLASANAGLASAQAQLSAAQTALSQATLVSPINGVVASVGISVGAQVNGSTGSSGASTSSRTGSSAAAGGATGSSAAGSSSSSGSGSGSSSAAVTVISTNSWIVDTNVTSADLANVKAGLQAQITPTGARSPIFGTVKSVGIVASSSTSGVAQFPVVVAVTGSPTGLYSGTSASVNIIVKQLTGVLTVPTLAVRTENSATVVTAVRGGANVTVPVTIGQVFGAQTQITKGLTSGDQVVLPTFGGSGLGTGRTGTGGTGAGRTGGAGFGGGTGFGGGAGGTGLGGGVGGTGRTASTLGGSGS